MVKSPVSLFYVRCSFYCYDQSSLLCVTYHSHFSSKPNPFAIPSHDSTMPCDTSSIPPPIMTC